MQSDIFGDGKQPILADYLERMDAKSSVRASNANSKERPTEIKVSGRKKKSGDANERELGETSFDLGFEQGEMHKSPEQLQKKNLEAGVKVDESPD